MRPSVRKKTSGPRDFGAKNIRGGKKKGALTGGARKETFECFVGVKRPKNQGVFWVKGGGGAHREMQQSARFGSKQRNRINPGEGSLVPKGCDLPKKGETGVPELLQMHKLVRQQEYNIAWGRVKKKSSKKGLHR